MNLSALEAKVTSDEGKQELNRLKMALNEAELLKQKYSSAPAAIDFASYKGKVDASLLALAEKEFKGVQYPPFAELDEAKAEYDAMFAEAEAKIAESKTRIDELTKQMNVMVCVEINQCVGCTRQFFTKSFLGDDAAVLARSSDEEPAPPRHRAGVASMAWRSTRRFSTNAP